ncbi:type IV pilin N-terminal domain-containing protein [Methanosarcina sp.]|uniref:type IV pilin N-terminal domain-containing protein n=1 Tax=Methanosarcina sp. TaxID=2213 RepID=UPI003C74D68C
MQGKKFRALGKNCQAVSEVYGQLLMISIVVIALSGVAMAVFSDGGAVKPEHTPNTDLRENLNITTNYVYITHSGGETIDLSAIKIAIYVEGQPIPKSPFDSSTFTVKKLDPNAPDSSKNIFMLGDCIAIDTGYDLKSSQDIDMFFVDIPSQQVIQKAVLQNGNRESNFPYWITPHPYGSIYDNSTKEWLPTELVDGIGDNIQTDCQMYKDQWSSENFTFGIDEYGLDLKNPLTKVLLKIVYTAHDFSQKDLTLEINDKNPDQWIIVAGPGMPLYKDTTTCDEELYPIDITSHVGTVEELRNLTVRFSAFGKAASDNKIGWVDFIGIHVES